MHFIGQLLGVYKDMNHNKTNDSTIIHAYIQRTLETRENAQLIVFKYANTLLN